MEKLAVNVEMNLIRIQYEIRGKDRIFWITLTEPEYFLSVEQAKAFMLQKNNDWLLKANARIIDEKIKVLDEF